MPRQQHQQLLQPVVELPLLGRQPALLLGWERRELGWYGRVLRPVAEYDGWVVVEEWLPAHVLDPAT